MESFEKIGVRTKTHQSSLMQKRTRMKCIEALKAKLAKKGFTMA